MTRVENWPHHWQLFHFKSIQTLSYGLWLLQDHLNVKSKRRYHWYVLSLEQNVNWELLVFMTGSADFSTASFPYNFLSWLLNLDVNGVTLFSQQNTISNDPMPVPKLKNHPGLLRLLEPKSKSQPEKRYMFLDINKVC